MSNTDRLTPAAAQAVRPRVQWRTVVAFSDVVSNATVFTAPCMRRHLLMVAVFVRVSHQSVLRFSVLDARVHNVARRRRRALPMTDTELKVMAALAITGLSKRPKNGYSTPAAIGTPSML
jgi:hypothetical protein